MVSLAGRPKARGFTVIELIVVMAVIAALLALAVPRYMRHLDKAREAALQHNLQALREALDNFSADRGRWPMSLPELVETRYLRELPLDPLTDRRDSWVVIPAQPPASGVAEVRSGAPGRALNGSEYASW